MQKIQLTRQQKIARRRRRQAKRLQQTKLWINKIISKKRRGVISA